MPKVPDTVQEWPLVKLIKSSNIDQLHMGKVRHTFDLSSRKDANFSGVYLPLASDRVSIFDFVLNATIPENGHGADSFDDSLADGCAWFIS